MKYFGSKNALSCRNFYPIALLFLKNPVFKPAVFIPQNLFYKNINNYKRPFSKFSGNFFAKNLLILFCLIFPVILNAQEEESKKIDFKSDWGMLHPQLPNVWILKENVSFHHEGMYLYSDSASYNEAGNNFDAFRDIMINVNDSIFIYGDVLHYDGNTRIAVITGKVRLVDDSTVLTTNYLQYDREQGICTYPYWGHTTDSKNELYSKKGYYYTASKDFFFKDSVILWNNTSKVISDTLQYNTLTDIAYFFGPTHIYSSDNYIYTEQGWYNTKTEQTQSVKNSVLKNKEQTLKADSVYYEKAIKSGRANGNVEITDSVNKITLTGLYAETDDNTNYSFLTGKATALIIEERDTLFVHADTIAAQSDTANNFEYIYGYYSVKFYRTDFQGVCDSICHNVRDSIMEMYVKPVVWTGENQFSADTIKVETGKNGAKRAFFYLNSLVISRSDSTEKNQYDQLKGRNMIGYFGENRNLDSLDVNGNCEFIYYIREETPDKTQSLIGINTGVSSDMKILFEEGKPVIIKALKQPVMVTYPEEQFTEDKQRLKIFRWEEAVRPQSKEDIYRK